MKGLFLNNQTIFISFHFGISSLSYYVIQSLKFKGQHFYKLYMFCCLSNLDEVHTFTIQAQSDEVKCGKEVECDNQGQIAAMSESEDRLQIDESYALQDVEVSFLLA